MPSEGPRRFCCDEDIERLDYEGHNAPQDLAAWRSRGPRRATQELIDVIRADGVEGAALLDIGAGVGTVHMLLLEAGAATAVDVDASRDYLAAARAEAEWRGLADRVAYHYGDVVELAAELPPADIVTLDAVICCYRYLPGLLRAAVRPGPRLVGLTYPRDVWWMRGWMRVFNVLEALRRRPGRYYIYRRAQVDRLMAEAGFGESYAGGTPAWRVVVYRPGVGSQLKTLAARSTRDVSRRADPPRPAWQTDLQPVRDGGGRTWRIKARVDTVQIVCIPDSSTLEIVLREGLVPHSNLIQVGTRQILSTKRAFETNAGTAYRIRGRGPVGSG